MKPLHKLIIISFVLGLLVRSLPEILLTGFPAGYDVTARYIPLTSVFTEVWRGRGLIPALASLPKGLRLSPGIFILSSTLHQAFGVDEFLLYKVLSPVIYGLISLSFSVYVYKVQKLPYEDTFKSTIMFLFHISSLRLSWDLLRTELGVSIGLLLLSALHVSTTSAAKTLILCLTPLIPFFNQPAVIFSSMLYLDRARVDLRLRKILLLAVSIMILALTPTIILVDRSLILSYVWVGEYRDFGSYQMAIAVLYIILYGWMLPYVARGLKEFPITIPVLTLLALSPIFLGKYAPVLAPRWLFLLVIPYIATLVKYCRDAKIRWFLISILVISGLNFSGGYISPHILLGRGGQGGKVAVQRGGVLSEIGMLMPPHLGVTSIGDYRCSPIDLIRAASWVSSKYQNMTVVAEMGKAYLIENYTYGLHVSVISDYYYSLQDYVKHLNRSAVYIATLCKQPKHGFSKVYSYGSAQVYIIEGQTCGS